MYTKTSLHVERIHFNQEFWKENVPKAEHIFKTAVLPELLGRWFSRPTISGSELNEDSLRHTENNAEEKYCYCGRGEDFGDMVGCDNNDCPYQWFHLTCLSLKSEPKSSLWYCPDCRKLDKFQRKRKNRAQTAL